MKKVVRCLVLVVLLSVICSNSYAQVLQGLVSYNGAPITQKTTNPATFWILNEDTNQVYDVQVNYSNVTGRYYIPSIPPGTYGIQVSIDAAYPFNGQFFPGDYYGYKNSIQVILGNNEQELACNNIIHLTSPADNSSIIGSIGVYPIKQSPILFMWDAILEASSYQILIDKWQSSPPYAFRGNVSNLALTDTQLSITLPDSLPDEHYQLSLYAYNGGLRVGQLMVVYDNGYGWDYRFRIAPTGLIDWIKWANLEFIRRIEGGALRSAVRSYGSNASNNLGLFNNTLNYPFAATSIKGLVTVNAFDNNLAFTRARIGGFFYKDTLGDIHAEVGIGENVDGGLKGYYYVMRCYNPPECSSRDELSGGYGEPLGTVNLGEKHTLLIAWDGGKKFTFTFDSGTDPVDVFGPDYSGPPNFQFKGIGTRVGGVVSPSGGGYIDANFDNVSVNGYGYDDFSSPMIDRNNWSDSTLEFVREQITEGVYGMALRSYGSFANNGLNLLNGQNFNEIQADLTVEQLINLPQPNPATPMAALQGNFYKVGAGVPGNPTGDIKALVGIRHNGTQPAAFYNIVKCTAPNCSIYPGEFDRLYFHEDPLATGPDLLGKPHRVSIRYNQSLNEFTFGFDGRLTTPGPSSPGWIVPPPLPAYHGPPNVGRKGPLARVAFYSGSSGEGYVSARFWNIATVVDTDGDGIPDRIDNCPAVYNPDQRTAACHGSPPPLGTPGIVCDPDPMCAPPGQEPTGSLTVAPSADGEIYADVTVNLKSIGNLQTPYVKPDPYNVVVRLYDHNTGAEVIADQVLCGPPCSLPDDLVYVAAGSSHDYSTTIPLSRWFRNLPAGSYDVRAEYVNYCNDLALKPDGTCPEGGDCLQLPENTGPIFQGQQELIPDNIKISFTLASNKTVDQCPDSSGDAGGTGCPYADKNIVTLHKVNLGGGPSTKQPLPMAAVRVFDRNSSEFLAVAGKSNPDGSKYGIIFEANKGFVGQCFTDSNGVCYVGETTTGNYLVIVKYSDPDTDMTVYVGRPKDPSDFNSSGIATKEFQIMKVFRNGVFQEYRGGSKMVVTGSILEVISPESAIWEGTSSIYPFVFTSDSSWSVDVCAAVPSGYKIVGVYDENGNLVKSSECVQALVSGETKAVAFEVQETGSPEPSLDATLTMISPKGKKQIKTLKASDIRKKSFEAELGKAKGRFKR